MEKATEVLENRNVILNYPIKLEEEGGKKNKIKIETPKETIKNRAGKMIQNKFKIELVR